MELRLWVPENVSGWRYCLRHPRSFLIGAYGFKRWHAEYQAKLALTAEIRREKAAHDKTRSRLIEAQRALSAARRAA